MPLLSYRGCWLMVYQCGPSISLLSLLAGPGSGAVIRRSFRTPAPLAPLLLPGPYPSTSQQRAGCLASPCSVTGPPCLTRSLGCHPALYSIRKVLLVWAVGVDPTPPTLKAVVLLPYTTPSSVVRVLLLRNLASPRWFLRLYATPM